jgi:hypothetical protein
MFYENPSLVRFSERMALWLPGAFSLALVVLSLAWNPLLTGGSQVAMPWHVALLMMGILGGTVHAVLDDLGRGSVRASVGGGSVWPQ